MYNKVICDEICARVANGESLRHICLGAHMPADSTVALWLSKYPEFSEQYRLSYEANLIVEAYSMREMIDNVNPTVAEIAKVKEQIVHRKWELSIQFPKKYGDKPVEETVAKVRNYDNISDEQLRQLIEIEKLLEDNESDK